MEHAKLKAHPSKPALGKSGKGKKRGRMEVRQDSTCLISLTHIKNKKNNKK